MSVNEISEKTRAFLALRALICNPTAMESDPQVSRYYLREKLDTMMKLTEPERILDDPNARVFDELVREQ